MKPKNRRDRRSFDRQARSLNKARLRLETGANGPFRELPRHEWPDAQPPAGCERFLVNEAFVVFDCATKTSVRHVMVQRVNGKGGITWDELFEVKGLIGYNDHEAVEIFPKRDHLHNVANVRHLWVLPENMTLGFDLRPAPPSLAPRLTEGESSG